MALPIVAWSSFLGVVSDGVLVPRDRLGSSVVIYLSCRRCQTCLPTAGRNQFRPVLPVSADLRRAADWHTGR